MRLNLSLRMCIYNCNYIYNIMFMGNHFSERELKFKQHLGTGCHAHAFLSSTTIVQLADNPSLILSQLFNVAFQCATLKSSE